ncbi:MAG: hypothetical protein K0B81_00830 [Candidatus Cloacimonetes bacterium]|nr:hypothetical protein [Candidatus Cloacimonadota bacterium]
MISYVAISKKGYVLRVMSEGKNLRKNSMKIRTLALAGSITGFSRSGRRNKAQTEVFITNKCHPE